MVMGLKWRCQNVVQSRVGRRRTEIRHGTLAGLGYWSWARAVRIRAATAVGEPGGLGQ
jgi:hypothetical protein